MNITEYAGNAAVAGLVALVLGINGCAGQQKAMKVNTPKIAQASGEERSYNYAIPSTGKSAENAKKLMGVAQRKIQSETPVLDTKYVYEVKARLNHLLYGPYTITIKPQLSSIDICIGNIKKDEKDYNLTFENTICIEDEDSNGNADMVGIAEEKRGYITLRRNAEIFDLSTGLSSDALYRLLLADAIKKMAEK